MDAVIEPAPKLDGEKAPQVQSLPPTQIPGGGWRVFFFISTAVLLTGLVSMLFADLLWRTGWSTSRTVLLVLFIPLFYFTAVGCMNAVFGFLLHRIGDRQRKIGRAS